MYSLLNTAMFDFFNQIDNSRVSNVDILEQDDKYLLEVEVPGNKNEDIKINEENGLLSIKSKYFTRNFDISKNIDVEKIEAKLNDGLLSISLGKKAQEQKRNIAIN